MDSNPVESDKKALPIHVTVSITLSKTVRIYVKDYEEEPMEQGGCFYNYEECDLKSTVEEQIKLPSEGYSDWQIDDFEVIKE